MRVVLKRSSKSPQDTADVGGQGRELRHGHLARDVGGERDSSPVSQPLTPASFYLQSGPPSAGEK